MAELTREELKYIPEHGENKAILGTLEGPCADFVHPTRNGRMYGEELWEKVFSSDIAKEYFANGGYPGECGHPTDRTETDIEKIAIMMPNPPKKDSQGHLIAKFHILDTPCGRIAKTLSDYGYKFGISSRGSGDVTEDMDGNESVEPDTYDFQAFDLVLLPAVKDARLRVVESLDNRKSFRRALNEQLEQATSSEREKMEEALDQLNISYSPERVNDIPNEESEEGSNASDSMMNQLGEALKQKLELENKVKELQEKLSVSCAKEVALEEKLTKYKQATNALNISLRESYKDKSKIDASKKEITELKSTIKNLQEKLNEQKTNEQELNEQLQTTRIASSDVKKEIKSLKESLQKKEEEKSSLIESYESKLKTEALKTDRANKQLSEQKTLTEKYKSYVQTAVTRYIDVKARMLGVDASEIRNRLGSKISFSAIDSICESLSSYRISIKKLPFDLQESKNITVKCEKAKNEVFEVPTFEDDVVDEQLLNLANMK